MRIDEQSLGHAPRAHSSASHSTSTKAIHPSLSRILHPRASSSAARCRRRRWHGGGSSPANPAPWRRAAAPPASPCGAGVPLRRRRPPAAPRRRRRWPLDAAVQIRKRGERLGSKRSHSKWPVAVAKKRSPTGYSDDGGPSRSVAVAAAVAVAVAVAVARTTTFVVGISQKEKNKRQRENLARYLNLGFTHFVERTEFSGPWQRPWPRPVVAPTRAWPRPVVAPTRADRRRGRGGGRRGFL